MEEQSNPRPPGGRQRPLISVLVSVQQHDEVVHCIEALAAQRGLEAGDLEVVVVDGVRQRSWRRRLDHALKRAGAGFRCRFIEIEPCGRAAALNTAVRHAEGELLLFLADDFIADRRLVARHLHFHKRYPETHRAAVGPAVFPGAFQKKRFMRWLDESGSLFGVAFASPGLRMPSRFFYVGNTSVKRALLEQAGPFDERFPFDAWDDYEMGLRLARLGYKASYLPKAICRHQHLVTLRERVGQVLRGGRSAAIYDLHHDDAQPWHSLVREPAVRENRWEHWRRMTQTWLRACIGRDAENWDRYYRLRLDSAFLEGYRLELDRRRD